MVAEGEAVSDGNHVAPVLRVVIPQHFQDANLNLSLLVKLLLVLEYLQGNLLFDRRCMVHTAYDYSECPASQLFDDLIPIVELVSLLDAQVISIFTIETIIVARGACIAVPTLSNWSLCLMGNFCLGWRVEDLGFAV